MAASRNSIEFECPRCLTQVRADSQDSGKRIACPNCQLSLVVPSQSISPALFEDIFDSLPLDQARDSDRETVKEPEDAEFAKPGDLHQPEPSQHDQQESGASSSPLPAPSVPILSDDDPLAGFEDPDNGDQLATPEPADPFAIDKHAPLKLDDFHEQFGLDDIWGIKCNVCDTRVHVNKHQVGTDIECPICYSTLHVTPLAKNPKSEQRWLQSKPAKSNILHDDELQLSASRRPTETRDFS